MPPSLAQLRARIEQLEAALVASREFVAGVVKPVAAGFHTISSYNPCHALIDKIDAALANSSVTKTEK